MESSQNDFTVYLQNNSVEIKKCLQDFSNEWDEYIAKNFPLLISVNRRFTTNLLGGKMLRGTLVNLGYDLFQFKKSKTVKNIAAAFEILHSSFLIHDDIIDQSLMRRGKPALHINGRNKQYGISQAICLGDLGISHAIKLICNSNFPKKRKSYAVNYFLELITNTILGEMLDVETSKQFNRSEKQIIEIYELKTAKYTITGPLVIGAMLGGVNNEILNHLIQFGEPLGIAFQIQDDILGIFGDEATIGKSTTSDIEENKSTLLYTYAFKKADRNQKNILNQYYGKKRITSYQHALIKRVFLQTGSLSYSQERIKILISKAKIHIPNITNDIHNQTLLIQLSDLLVERSK